MENYGKNFLTQVLARADFIRGSVPLTASPDALLTGIVDEFPLRSAQNRVKNEVRVQKTPQGPARTTNSIPFTEFLYTTEDKSRTLSLCSEHIYLEARSYPGFDAMSDTFLSALGSVAETYPQLKISRLGLRFINEIRLPEADAGPGLGADFWENYINPLLLGGLRFAANDGALARHMCSTELNYGTDRVTFKYGIFNNEYPKPNRKREFILDIDTYCTGTLTAVDIEAKLADFHRAARDVFETAISDRLRARLR